MSMATATMNDEYTMRNVELPVSFAAFFYAVVERFLLTNSRGEFRSFFLLFYFEQVRKIEKLQLCANAHNKFES